MNKKFLSAVLFGALMVSSTGTFTSCKDYDDDIDNLQTQITANADAIKKLQDLVGQGNWVTSVVGIENGIKVTMSNGTTTDIVGINGEDGKDGKDGTVVTIIDGYWAFDGVKSEYPATPKESSDGQDAHEIKISEDGYWMIWNAEKGEYETTPYAVAPISATQNTNGSWTISIKNPDGTIDKIDIPATALVSIEVDNLNASINAMTYWYGVVNENVKWGWNKEETMEAGFYSKLQSDVRVLLNPAGVHGDSYKYTFKNSKGTEAPVTFFKTAKPYDGPALTRTASSNGLWVLPAEITKNPAEKIEELRRELYLSFKVNDSNPYRLALEASDEQGNTVRSEYTNTVTLSEADATSSSWVSITNEYYNMVGTTYYPEITNVWSAGGQVYKYKIRLNQDPDNLRWAKVFGVKITEDGMGYYAENESAVSNGIRFDICGVYINGNTFTQTNAFSVYFTNEMVTDRDWAVDAINKVALDATLADRTTLNPYINSQVVRGEKVFEYTYTYDLSSKVAELSEDEALVWDQAIQRGTIYSLRDNFDRYEEGLIGGEGEYNSTNLNWLMNQHMTWSINPRNAATKPNLLTVKFYVSDSWSGFTYNQDAIEAANFKLGTAYQLTLYVADPENEVANVAKIVLPFEFTQPTLDITRVDGKFTEWNDGKTALYAYGHLCNNADDEMRLPLYDSFTAWKAKNPAAGITGDYQKYKDNAEYYDVRFNVPVNTEIMGQSGVRTAVVSLDNALNYAGVDHNLNTMAQWNVLNSFASLNPQEELEIPMAVDYKYYGVYSSNEANFSVYFASWLKHSVLATTKDTYTTERGTHQVLLTNADINFKTPKGGAYYLFDDLDGTNEAKRSIINGDTFNEVNHYPFTGFSNTSAFYGSNNITGLFDATDNHFKAVEVGNMSTRVTVVPKVLTSSDIKVDPTTGVRYIDPNAVTPDANNINVYLVPSVSQSVDPTVVTDGIADAFRGGMLVVLPQNYNEQDGAVITVTLKDIWGYTNQFSFTVTKL